MTKSTRQSMVVAGVAAYLCVMTCLAGQDDPSWVTVDPVKMPRICTVDERFQSYNIEMLEVTGGAFWKPYGQAGIATAPTDKPEAAQPAAVPAGMDPAIYQYRPPIDLANNRLRTLAAGLAPAYVRVSGTWANSTYLPAADEPETPTPTPPKGYNGVLTRKQWAGVVEFSHAVDAKIVTSFASSPGTRDSGGLWTPAQANRFLDYTKSLGGSIAAAEFMNEPTLAAMGGAPSGYDAAAYGRDFKIFRPFLKKAAPDMLILGPGAVGETPGSWSMNYASMPIIASPDLLTASGPGVDAFSYHHYGAASERCAGAGMPQTTAAAALSEEWLARTSQTLAYYSSLRDKFEPGKPLWLTETAEAACGGNRWGSTFLDTFRYLDQLGRLAKGGVQVVMHNTLVASDYGLLDENTLSPKPNYWGALLWRKLMGTTVLDSGVPIKEGLHLYAHSLRGHPGGVALLAINNNRTQSVSIDLPVRAERYTLSAPTETLDSREVQLNGKPLALGPGDHLPELPGIQIPAGRVVLAPATITFLAIPDAGHSDTR